MPSVEYSLSHSLQMWVHRSARMLRYRWFYARHSVEVVKPLNRRFLVVGSGRAGSARAKALENMVGFDAVMLPSRSPNFSRTSSVFSATRQSKVCSFALRIASIMGWRIVP